MANRSLSADQAEALAREAYTYLYPLVLMDTTRRQATNVAAGQAVGRGPANEFVASERSRRLISETSYVRTSTLYIRSLGLT